MPVMILCAPGGRRVLIAMVLMTTALAACGGAQVRHVGRVSVARRCATAGRRTTAVPPGPQTLGRDPLGGLVCVLPGSDGSRLSALRLTAQHAATLVRLLELPGSPSGCTASDVVIELRYRTGMRTLRISSCSPDRLSSDPGNRSLSGAAAAAVDDLGQSASGPHGSVRTPDDLDLPVMSVARTIGSYRDSSTFTTVVPVVELVDRAVPAGRVVWQNPLPGVPQDPDDIELTAWVAVPPARACSSQQLRGVYEGQTSGTGDEFGTFELGDTGTRPCTLRGRISLIGVNARGVPIIRARSQPEPHLVLLPVGHAGVRYGTPFTTTTGFVGGSQTPLGGVTNPCAPLHLRTPTVWIITFSSGATVRFPNADSFAGKGGGPFSNCGGQIDLGLGTATKLNDLVGN
jgi:hypothetical protein